MSKLKLVVFDWDGTLADSVGKIIECKKNLANKYQLPAPSVDVIKNVLGMKFEHALTKCFPGVDKEVLDKVGREFHSLMQQRNFQATIFQGVKELLTEYKKQGLKLAVATSKVRSEFNKALVYNNLVGMFDISCCGDEYEGKPNLQMLCYIMDQLAVKPDECLMIGDTTTDILFAANAGVKSIAVTFGAHNKQKLQMANPFAIVDNWQALTNTINKLIA